MKKNLLYFLFLMITATAFTQKNFKPGYIIESGGDTVFCNIDYRDWSENPKLIQVEKNGNINEKGLNDITGFSITGFASYEKKLVTYHLNPTGGITIPTKFSDQTQTETVFLKVLEKGNFSLYELVMPIRFYFFIQDGTGEVKELIYRVRQEDNVVTEDKQYKNVLLRLFEKNIFNRNEYEKKVEYSDYSDKSLIAIVAKLNGKAEEIIKRNEKARNRLEGFVFGGVYLDKFPTSFGTGFPIQSPIQSLKFDQSVSPTIGFNITYAPAAKFSKMEFGFAGAYKRISTQKNATKTDSQIIFLPSIYYLIKQESGIVYTASFVTAKVYVSYTFNPFGKAKFYLLVGGELGFFAGNENLIESNFTETVNRVINGTTDRTSIAKQENPKELNKLWLNGFMGTGIEFSKHKIELHYGLPADRDPVVGRVFRHSSVSLFYFYRFSK